MPKEPLTSVRLDRWLMAARFYKTRTQAAAACDGGKIKVNGAKAKPHKIIRVGDKLSMHNKGRYRDVEVLGLAQRGLPPAVARELYHEEEKQPLSEESREILKMVKEVEKKHNPRTKGRPTKRERRQIDQMRDKMFTG